MIFNPSLVRPRIEVTLYNPDNTTIKVVQTLEQFLVAPHPDIEASQYGGDLLNLLQQEGYISKDLTLLQVVTDDPEADATRLLGFIAEAMVVKLCNENQEVNRELAKIARFGRAASPALDRYLAIGTGLNETKNWYAIHYNPCDPQRDIIWVRKENHNSILPCMDYSPYPDTPAGLQVKASWNGIKYVVPSIKNYFFPILYFDLNNDWTAVFQKVSEAGFGHLMVPFNDMLYFIKENLRCYHHLIVQLLRGELTLMRLIELAQWEDPVLLAGLVASDTEVKKNIIIMSD